MARKEANFGILWDVAGNVMCTHQDKRKETHWLYYHSSVQRRQLFVAKGGSLIFIYRKTILMISSIRTSFLKTYRLS